MTLYRRQQNEELVVPGDESAYFEAVHDAMEYSRFATFDFLAPNEHYKQIKSR